jgi:hypothetical protein
LRDRGLLSQLVWYVCRHKDENTQTCDREGQANQGVLDRRNFFPPPTSNRDEFPRKRSSNEIGGEHRAARSRKKSKQITSALSMFPVIE